MRYLYVLRGVAGCGKSTWIEKSGLKPWTISSDDIRLLFNSPILNVKGEWEISQKQNKKVWNLIYDLMDKRMRNGELLFIDATHTRPSSFTVYKKLAKKHMYKLRVIDFTDAHLELIKERNEERAGYKRVPNEVIERMYKDCQLPLGKEIEVLKPEEYNTIKDSQDIITTLGNCDKLVVIGDIHSCYTPLKQYFDEHPFDDRTYYVFLGDFFDRGIETRETLEFLLSIYDKPNVCLIRGNHELWIDNYVNDGEEANVTPAFKMSLSEMGELKSELYKIREKLVDAKIILFGDKGFIFTHGGTPDIPTSYFPAMQCIKGVGEYSDTKQVEESFLNKKQDVFLSTPRQYWFYEEYFMFHGHRNLDKAPIQNDRVFNLEGQVEFGGHLRIVEVTYKNEQVKFNNIEIKNDVYDKDLRQKEFDTNDSVINELDNSPLIHKKDLGDGTSSYNFTREAFWDSKWNDLTTTARGLFIDNETNGIVARSYPKFFAIEERPETQMRNLDKTLQFPVKIFRKENGYLGIVSMRKGELYVCSKSTNKGDYAGWFKELLLKSVNDINGLKKYLSEHNVSMIFEVIDTHHDPHIIHYLTDEIYLLDIVKNDFTDTFLSYDEVVDVASYFGLEHKHWICDVHSMQQLDDVMKEVNDWNIEGFVAVDSKGFMFKYKTPYYKYWKYIRSLRDKILTGKELPELTNDVVQVVSYMKGLHSKGLLEGKSIPEIRFDFHKFVKDETAYKNKNF